MREVQVAGGHGMVWHTRTRVDSYEEVSRLLTALERCGLEPHHIGGTDGPHQPLAPGVPEGWIAHNHGALDD